MKHVMFALAIVVALLVAGCQDNSVTEPATNAAARAASFTKPHPTSNVIVLRGVVADPDNEKGSGVEITGQVRFVRNPVVSDRDEQLPNEQFDLTLQTEAEFHSLAKDGFSYKVEGASTDRIAMSKSGDSDRITLTKAYSFIDGDTQISLHLLFEVTSTDISVKNMWLTRSTIYDNRQAADRDKQ
jgi:hypothetical protein